MEERRSKRANALNARQTAALVNWLDTPANLEAANRDGGSWASRARYVSEALGIQLTGSSIAYYAKSLALEWPEAARARTPIEYSKLEDEVESLRKDVKALAHYLQSVWRATYPTSPIPEVVEKIADYAK